MLTTLAILPNPATISHLISLTVFPIHPKINTVAYLLVTVTDHSMFYDKSILIIRSRGGRPPSYPDQVKQIINTSPSRAKVSDRNAATGAAVVIP